jgi:hypothetical protein
MVNMLLTVLGNAHGLAAGTIGAAAQGSSGAAAAAAGLKVLLEAYSVASLRISHR